MRHRGAREKPATVVFQATWRELLDFTGGGAESRRAARVCQSALALATLVAAVVSFLRSEIPLSFLFGAPVAVFVFLAISS